ncbi:hypothetical protein DXG03_003237 [Asterophora parasitica]|uniref:DNA ligase n=1 Tax=Asterophora parasitica TaxID=117018 RepID=A0A9P7KE08_9AGAR|nr:hypothetical protein DXG03_003237 [Asterophora parasitica]
MKTVLTCRHRDQGANSKDIDLSDWRKTSRAPELECPPAAATIISISYRTYSDYLSSALFSDGQKAYDDDGKFTVTVSSPEKLSQNPERSATEWKHSQINPATIQQYCRDSDLRSRTMPKRSRASSPSKSPPKRTKNTLNQPRIHQFFSSHKSEVTETGSVSSIGSGSLGLQKGKPAQVRTPEVIDVDLLEAENDEKVLPLAVSSFVEQAASGTAGDISPRLFMIKNSAINEPIIYDDLTIDPLAFVSPHKPWSSTAVPYSFLAHTLSALAQTRSRITIGNILTNCLRIIILHDPPSLLPAIYLLSNTLAPPYSSIELGLGPSIISRSIQRISGLTAPALKRLYNSTGDIGDVAFAAKSNICTLLPHPPLLVNFVHSSLLRIASCKGQGTSKEKEKIVEKLLLAATGEEIRFLARTLSQNLRVGAVRTSILSALSRAMVLIPMARFSTSYSQSSYHASFELLRQLKPIAPGKGKVVDRARGELLTKYTRAEGLIKQIYVQHPNYEHIVSALLQDGLDGLEERVKLTVGIPLHPTLGSPTRSLSEVYDISQDRPFVAEFKYDGQRAQIHGFKDNGNVLVKIFSRHLEDMTTKYPDVTALVKLFFEHYPDTSSFIMDTEIVAIDPDGVLKTFQQLSGRARKDVKLEDVRISVSILAFDLMYLDGENTLSGKGEPSSILDFPPLLRRISKLLVLTTSRAARALTAGMLLKSF